MVRQLFEALVCMVRGMEGCVEHPYQADALYVQYRGRDAHYILHNDNVRKSQPVSRILSEWFPGYLPDAPATPSVDFPDVEGSNDKEPLTAILFLWDPKPTTFRKEPMRMANLSLHVASFMYAWTEDNDKIEPYMNAMDKHLRDNPHQTFVFLSQPPISEGVVRGITEPLRVARNIKMAEWVIDRKGPNEDSAKCEGPCRRWLVDYSEIVEVNRHRNIIPRPDGLHFGCSWREVFPEQIKSLRYNRNECKDRMNYAVLQWLLALLVRIQS